MYENLLMDNLRSLGVVEQDVLHELDVRYTGIGQSDERFDVYSLNDLIAALTIMHNEQILKAKNI